MNAENSSGGSQRMSTQDERLLSALSHFGIALPAIGLLVASMVWITQKDKSEYVAFQALQALAYQAAAVLGYFVGMGCYALSFFLIFLGIPLGGMSGPSSSGAPGGGELLLLVLSVTPFVIFFMILGAWFFLLLYGIVGAVRTLQGADFHYAIIGRRVARFRAQSDNVHRENIAPSTHSSQE